MKVLIYGSGAREHALAWKIKQSPLLTKLFLCKPNDGFSNLGEVINFNDYEELALTAKKFGIEMVIIGPEAPLVEGIADEFKKIKVPIIGSDKNWSQLEGSKSFAKEFMIRNNIPTAKYEIINSFSEIDEILLKFSFPVVIKADGLAAGKGVEIVESKKEAVKVINEFLSGKFGVASQKIIVEEFIDGREISLISIWDGKNILKFAPARDYKRLIDCDNGPNTGGMGSYCPVEMDSVQHKYVEDYVLKLKNALIREKADFVGIIYSGLILTNSGIKVLEYNVRFGDPETQPLVMSLKTDLLEIFKLASQKRLDEVKLEWSKEPSYCVVVATEGYPENPIKGSEIISRPPALRMIRGSSPNNPKVNQLINSVNLNSIEERYGLKIFYAGVKRENDKLLTNGGRVLSVCKTGNNALNDIYNSLEEIYFKNMHFRKDIGK